MSNALIEVMRPNGTLPGSYSPRFRRHIAKLFRYAATSGIALGISEIVLIALFSTKTFNATVSALIATLAGTIPSYLLSRYWIWAEASRARVGRQVTLYWLTSLGAMVVTSVCTGLIESLAPRGHHLLFASGGFLFMNLVLWVTKYAIYQKIIFKSHHHKVLEVA